METGLRLDRLEIPHDERHSNFMADEPLNHTLELLRRMDAKLDRILEDTSLLKRFVSQASKRITPPLIGGSTALKGMWSRLRGGLSLSRLKRQGPLQLAFRFSARCLQNRPRKGILT